MRDRLIELLTNMYLPINVRNRLGSYDTVGERRLGEFEINGIADHLLANGVIVPPCKVGDTLWVNWGYCKSKEEPRPVKVYALRFDTKKNNMRICVEGKFKISSYDGSYPHYYNGTFAWNSVGKTVFLTKEEAGEALAERSGE